MILNFIERGGRPRKTNTILKEDNKVGGQKLLDFKTYNKAEVIKIVWYWWKERQIGMEQKRESKNMPKILSADLWQRSKGNIMEQNLLHKWC